MNSRTWPNIPHRPRLELVQGAGDESRKFVRVNPAPVPTLKLFCPECGQKLLVNSSDLRRSVTCPRCAKTHNLAAIIPRSVTLDAVPLPEEAVLDQFKGAESSGVALAGYGLAVDEPTRVDHDLEVLFGPDNAQREPARAKSAVQPELVAARPLEHIATPTATAHDPMVSDEEKVVLPSRGQALLGGILRVGAQFDALCHGRRGDILGALVLLSAMTRFLDFPRLNVAALVLFVSTALVFSLVRFVATPDGQPWTPSALRQEVSAPFAHARSTVQACLNSWLRPLPKGALLDRLQATSATLKLFGVPLYPLALVFSWEGTLTVATASVILGYAGATWFWLTRPRLVSTPATCARAALAVPAVLDAREAPADVRASAVAVEDQAVKALLDALACWQTRRRPLERDYQRALYRHLNRHAPGLDVAMEKVVLSHDGVVRRVDLLVASRIVIELKVDRGNVSEEDRAMGQVREYARIWRDRGVVILLVCGTRSPFHQSRYAREVAQLHASGQPVITVAAPN